MKFAIAIFVKTPGVSSVKTRLAASLGQQKAEYFYELSLNCIISSLSALKNTAITPYWAVGEKQSLDHPLWSDFSCLHTGEGDLGDRQSHVYHQLLKNHDAVILIGADAPQLSVAIVEQAMQALTTHDYTIGPANDGGYYLLGGRRAIPVKVWSTTPWSDAKTKETLVGQLDSQPYELVMLSDVDTENDLHLMHSEMPEKMNTDQRKLKDWVRNLNSTSSQSEK